MIELSPMERKQSNESALNFARRALYTKKAMIKLALAKTFLSEENEFHKWLDFDTQACLFMTKGDRKKYQWALIDARNKVGEHGKYDPNTRYR